MKVEFSIIDFEWTEIIKPFASLRFVIPGVFRNCQISFRVFFCKKRSLFLQKAPKQMLDLVLPTPLCLIWSEQENNNQNQVLNKHINSFHATGLFQYPLKTSGGMKWINKKIWKKLSKCSYLEFPNNIFFFSLVSLNHRRT